MEGLYAGMEDIATPKSEAVGNRRRRLETTNEGGKSGGDILNATVKLTLANSLRVRVLASLAYVVYNVPTSFEVITAMKTATQKFATMQKDLKEQKGLTPDAIRDRMGIPCVHAFMAMCQTISDGCEQTMKDQLCKAMQAWNQLASQASLRLWQYVHLSVKLCRMEKMWDASRKKLVMKVEGAVRTSPPLAELTPAEFWNIVVKPKILAHPTVKEMVGVAPPGELERTLQGHLDQVKD